MGNPENMEVLTHIVVESIANLRLTDRVSIGSAVRKNYFSFFLFFLFLRSGCFLQVSIEHILLMCFKSKDENKLDKAFQPLLCIKCML